jgi:hypothetical protein
MDRVEKGSSEARGFLTVRQCAKILHRDRHTIYRQIWKHRLKGLKRRGRWVVPASLVTKNTLRKEG